MSFALDNLPPPRFLWSQPNLVKLSNNRKRAKRKTQPCLEILGLGPAVSAVQFTPALHPVASKRLAVFRPTFRSLRTIPRPSPSFFSLIVGLYAHKPHSHHFLISNLAVFGWEFPNVRLLADEYARAGFHAYIPDIQSGDAIPLDFLQNVEPSLKAQENLSLADKAKNAAVVPTVLGPWIVKHREAVTRPLVDGFINTVRMIPGTNKIGAIGFCWGGRYAVLQAHGRSLDGEGSSIGGVDAAYACHPSMISIPGDFEPVTKPLSIALGSKDGLTDVNSAEKIKEVLDAKKNVPHEIQVWFPCRVLSDSFESSRAGYDLMTCTDAFM